MSTPSPPPGTFIGGADLYIADEHYVGQSLLDTEWFRPRHQAVCQKHGTVEFHYAECSLCISERNNTT